MFMNWDPVEYSSGVWVIYVPRDKVVPKVEVFVGSDARKITYAGWLTLEHHYGIRWLDLSVRSLDSGDLEVFWGTTHLVSLVPFDPAQLSDQCPTCGQVGRFVRMALTCSIHGMFAGC